MPVGTVLCVVQDRYTSYHRVVMRYYVAQGAWMGREQRSLFVTAEDDPAATLQSLPSWQTKDDKEEKREEEDKVIRSLMPLESLPTTRFRRGEVRTRGG